MQQQTIDLTIDAREIRALSKLNSSQSILALLVDWLLIALGVVLHLYFSHPLIFFVSWLLIGCRMYALYSLLHESIHYLLFPNRKINDWLTKLFIAGPLFISLRKIRKIHLSHHQHLKTDGDPELVHLQYKEFQFPLSLSNVAFTFIKDVTGFNFIFYKTLKLVNWIKQGKQKNVDISTKAPHQEYFDAVMYSYYVVGCFFILWMGWGLEFLVYWVFPYISIYQVLNRLRLSTEHFYIPKHKPFHTRTVQLNFIERFLFSPHNLGLHTEHHLYPSIPFYRLPTLHKRLMSVPDYKRNVWVSHSYFKVIREYIK